MSAASVGFRDGKERGVQIWECPCRFSERQENVKWLVLKRKNLSSFSKRYFELCYQELGRGMGLWGKFVQSLREVELQTSKPMVPAPHHIIRKDWWNSNSVPSSSVRGKFNHKNEAEGNPYGLGREILKTKHIPRGMSTLH